MRQLQRVYSLVLNPVYRMTGQINEKIRNGIISLCCLFLSGFFIAYYDTSNWATLYLRHGQNNLICGLVLLILIIFSINAPLKDYGWDIILFWLMFAAGLGLVIVSFIHPVGSGYRSFGFMLMFEFPCLYYVWNNRGDYNTLYIRLAGATSIVGLAYYLKVVTLALTGDLTEVVFRVYATFYNANLLSMVGMVMVCSSLYMFSVKRSDIKWFIFSVVSFAAGWDIIRMGVSRLSMLVGFGGIFAYCVFWFKTRKHLTDARTFRVQFIRFGCIVIATVLFLLNGEVLLNINTAMQYRRNNEVSAEQGAAEDAEGGDTAGIPDEAAQHDISSATDRFSTQGKDLNTYTAGRIAIWQRYAEHLNMLGNDMDAVDFTELTGVNVKHAHNNFLEFGFRCGIPVAIIHTLLELYAGIVCIIFLFSRKYRDPAYLFAVIFMICYAVESVFDIATVPFERHAPFYFYMILIPVFGRYSDMRRKAEADPED